MALLLPSPATVLGVADSGGAARLLLPAVRVVFYVGAATTVGWLVAAAIWLPADPSGRLTVAGLRAARAGAESAGVWAVSGLLLVPLSVSELSGRSVIDAARGGLVLQAASIFGSLQANLISAVVAVGLAVGARLARRSSTVLVLAAVAIAGVAPQAFAGHASDSDNHDIAVDLMIYHLVGACLWVGGLVAVVALTQQKVAGLSVVVSRYSATALAAFVAVAASGAASAAVRISAIGDLWTTDYGRLVVGKSALLLALGVAGWWQRRWALAQLRQGRTRPLLAVAGAELVLMAATVAVAATLARTASPAIDDQSIGTVRAALGFDLPGPPTVWRLVTAWRPDLLLGVAAIAAALLYLRAADRLRRRGVRWPVKRTVAWALGCVMVLIATSSGLDRYAQTQFSLHMIVHMTLGMLAPILLVLGGPVTLALRSLPPAGRGQPPRMRELIVAVTHSRALRFVSHPLVAVMLFVGSFYAIYFTGLFGLLISSHLGHLVMNLHLLTVGYLYYWLIIGMDPAARRFPPVVKLGLLMVTLPFHAVFGLSLMNSHAVIASDYYRQFSLPWVPDLLADQRLGGAIAWALADIPTAIVIIALVSQWFRADERDARRADRRADRDGDDELTAYNAMLTRLHDRHVRETGQAGAAIPDRSTTEVSNAALIRPAAPNPADAGHSSTI
ncbi:cytochrome c oxidase assembly protein [Nakamurella endophytica]|uniref:Copper resistance D n=1 Tax=Nakamurella endophytica TaxID=1748367 RepID=A0A917T3G0_9ACTN|nr:cytochrome c oxidase assembly protein [Nakamurella endophytica]GGM09274.1 copper resistance D precursor [Nakamurella endophytica]